MPSPRHDIINLLFRERPELAVEILRDLKGLELPETPLVRVESNDFNDRPSKDFRPDTVITTGPPQKPVHGIIVEVQQQPSESKLKQLPRYAAALWLKLDRPVTVLVICPEPETARYFTGPIPTDLPGYELRVVVLGPTDIPMISEAQEAAAHPELALLSVMTHPDPKVVTAFVQGLGSTPSEHATEYYEYAYSVSAPTIRRILEDLVTSTDWPVYSPFAREHFGRGKAEGELEEAAKSILLVLDARGITIPDDTRNRISTCTDHHQLQHWLQRAATIDSAEGLFV